MKCIICTIFLIVERCTVYSKKGLDIATADKSARTDNVKINDKDKKQELDSNLKITNNDESQ